MSRLMPHAAETFGGVVSRRRRATPSPVPVAVRGDAPPQPIPSRSEPAPYQLAPNSPSAVPPPASDSIELARAGTAAAIVTCHNYGRYLRQCLDSILAQTLPFNLVLVVDDASTDDTRAIAAEFAARGVRYLRGEWRAFTAARRAGVAALPRMRFLLFVDADNFLSPDFHERLREPMQNPKCGVGYAGIRHVDERGEAQRSEAWITSFDYWRLRRGNYADACSLIRTEAYEQVGGWESDLGGLTDWLLWLKITRAGWTMECAPRAQLFYREHGANLTAHFATDCEAAIRAAVDVMRRGFIVTIVTLFSGRAWQLGRYAEAIGRLNWRRDNLRLVAIDNSRDAEFGARLSGALSSIGIPFVLVRETRRAVAAEHARDVADSVPLRCGHAYAINEHLAALYALARQQLPVATDLVWCLEDDIEPPSDALEKLCAGLHMHGDAGVISACVRDRFCSRLLAFRGPFDADSFQEDFGHLKEPPAGDAFEQITASGFMCSIFRREIWDAIAFRPAPLWNNVHPYYDWAAAHEVQRLGWRWLLAGSVHCKHWQADGTFIPVTRAGPCGCGGKCGGCG